MSITARLSTALADRYKIESHLGEGGMANVYLAHDLKHDRPVAVKVLRPELAAVLGAERFLQEIKTTANLQHPHILPLFDSGEADSFLYYVMPFIDGETLRDKLNRETQLGIEEAVKITTEVADALHYAHGENVVHRDIKPENILLHNGRPMVADFGIALAVSAAAGGRMTETGLSLGTPHYMSPEQATAEKDLTSRSDIYSLGCVLYEMLTGEPPHTGGSAQAIIMKIVTEPADAVTKIRKSVPPNVTTAVAKALEKLAADRFESAAKFGEALTNPAFTLPTTQAATMAGAPASGPWNRLSIGSTAIAVLASVVALWALSRPAPEKPVLRHSVALNSEDAPTLERGGTRFALAPDGKRLVYLGVSEQTQRSQLRVRSRDQLDAAPLPGTDGAFHPFFSPDGGRVGFLTQSPLGLHVASLGGGPPITVTDAGVSGQRGGARGPDGHLYAQGLAPPHLVRVPAGGGVPEPVTTLDTAKGENNHGWPEALPNGKGMLFTVAYGTGPTEFDIAVVDLATGMHRVLVRGVAAKYATSGHLVYVTADGTLMAAPFDEDAMVLAGEATALVQGVGVVGIGVVDLTVSETGTLMYTTGSSNPLAELMSVTREGTAAEIHPGWTGDFSAPRFSPDGSRLAITVSETNEQQIWIKQLDRGPLAKLTFEASNFRAAWTPDGQWVAFVSDRGISRDLYVRRADGTGQAEVLLDREEQIWEVHYSRDGQWIVYRAETPSSSIYATHVDADSIQVPLVETQFNERLPRLSPDGRWLAYMSDESGLNEVYVRPFPNVTEGKWLVSNNGGIEPVWAHSGQELFYKSGSDLMSAEVLSGTTFVLGERKALFSVEGFRFATNRQMYDVTPDDQRFVMIRNLGGPEASEMIVVENFFEELKAKVGNE